MFGVNGNAVRFGDWWRAEGFYGVVTIGILFILDEVCCCERAFFIFRANGGSVLS